MQPGPKSFFPAAVLLLLVAATSCKDTSQGNYVSGTIETDEVRVASRYGGRVEKILAQEGDRLEPGQVLVELEASELQPRRALAAAQLAELEAGPRKEELASAKQDWEALMAQLENARSEAKRAEQLLASKSISATEHDLALSRSQTLESSTASARSRYELLLAGTRPERIAQARAQLADIDTQLKETKIMAPSNSVLEVLSVKVGDVVPANREVATLLLTQHLWVRVYVPEPWLSRIRLGEEVRVRVDPQTHPEFTGVVEQIARQAEFTPRNVQTVGERMKQVFGIKVRLNNPQDKLRAGMNADVFFP